VNIQTIVSQRAFGGTSGFRKKIYLQHKKITEYGNRIHEAPDLRTQLSSIKPSIKRICEEEEKP
jgi:hypothetical protein